MVGFWIISDFVQFAYFLHFTFQWLFLAKIIFCRKKPGITIHTIDEKAANFISHFFRALIKIPEMIFFAKFYYFHHVKIFYHFHFKILFFKWLFIALADVSTDDTSKNISFIILSKNFPGTLNDLKRQKQQQSLIVFLLLKKTSNDLKININNH